jgi:hypothetical protein
MALVRPRLTDYYGIPLGQATIDFAIPFSNKAGTGLVRRVSRGRDHYGRFGTATEVGTSRYNIRNSYEGCGS